MLKGIKISKTGWIILAAGIFVVVLAFLGITRSGQVKQQNKLGTDLATSQTRLDKVDTGSNQGQLDELKQQLADSEQQLAGIKEKLHQPIQSVDVADKFYELGKSYSVNVTIFSSTKIVDGAYQGVPCSLISLRGTAEGDVPNIVDFVAGLNDNFTTGYVESASIQIADVSTNDTNRADISLVVYSYEGN
ncbi:MAG: hypothetical protein ABR886_04625 [Dehalococcoidales bacterium]|jgi:hypothetical protein